MPMTDHFPEGTNLRYLLEECLCDESLLVEPLSVREPVIMMIQTAGFHLLADVAHSFEGGGYTAAFILAESHVVVHTWPEHNRLVLIEASVCDFTRSNRERTIDLGERLAAFYLPQKTVREVLSMIPRLADKILPGQGYHVEVERLVAERKSQFQTILIAETQPFGRSLLLDGVFQTSSSDDFCYHEPLVQIPMLSHDDPHHVLICGGGDGGAAREVLKHPSVETCTLVEIDEEVIALSRQELRCIHQGSLDDPRVKIIIQDAREFIQNTKSKFDVIILDTTDPFGISVEFYTDEFFSRLKCILEEEGCITLHMGSPFQMNAAQKKMLRSVQRRFDSVYTYLNFVPCYGTLLGYLLCFKGEVDLLSPSEIALRLHDRDIHDLKIINSQTYTALFTIPPYLHSFLDPER